MSTGVPVLDGEHKRLIAMINKLGEAMAESTHAQVEHALSGLMNYVTVHFANEEKVFSALGFPNLEAHQKLHAAFTAKVHLLDEKYEAAATDEERLRIGTILYNLLQDWLVNHILKEDLKVKPLVPNRPNQAAQHSKPAQEWIQERAGMPKDQAPKVDRNRDIEYSVPPELERLLKRIEYVVPDIPEPEGGFESFDKLCEAAINRRIDKVLIFFQRHNPSVRRQLPPFFLASPEFAEKFHQAVVKFIFPVIWESRQIKVLSTSFDWANSNTEDFWKYVSKQLQQVILEGWNVGWDNLKLVEVKKPDGTLVYQVKPELKELRELLQPSSPESYDLPRVNNRDIDTFKSLLDPAEDWWDMLNRAWQTCHDLYEQEKDPRVFQQKAREGALRDNLIAAFNRYPEQWADFLVLACHRVFPRFSTAFLESFSRNFGRNEAEREAHLPYTMRYLRHTYEHPEIARNEQREEDEWKEQMQMLSDYLKEPQAGSLISCVRSSIWT